jgi:multiple sugar transport system substrate-binding protein
MKFVFLISAVVLLGWTVLAVVTLPERRSTVPLMYWTSDANPARFEQIDTFERWMREHSYPDVDLELDSNNGGTMKVIIQSASGVGSDLIDVWGGAPLRQLVAAGVVMDVTDLAKEYGFGPEKTYPAAYEDLFVNGRQYGFPCNLTANPFTINKALLEREHLPLPKFDWNWDEFLAWAQAVRKTDSSGRTTRFAVVPFGADRLWPGNGGSVFNETMTHCTVDSPECVEATAWYYDLIFKPHVMPTPVEFAAMAAQGGYGGAYLQMIGNEQALGIGWGRYSLIQLRRFKNFSPDVALLPHKRFAIQIVGARAATINAGAKDPKLAARFLQYLTSDEYNKLIIDGLDGLPPNPASLKWPSYTDPPGHPDEGIANVKDARAALDHGVGREYSPFVNPSVVARLIGKYASGMESGALSVAEALRQLAAEINLEMSHAVERDPAMRKPYDDLLAKQKRIDAMKLAGERVPLEMIDNPVIRKIVELERKKD